MPTKRRAARARASLAGLAMALMVLLAQGGRLLWRALAAGAWPATGPDAAPQPPGWAAGLVGLALSLLALGLPLLLLRRGSRPYGEVAPFKKGAVPTVVLLPLFLGLMVVANSVSNLLRGLVGLVVELPAVSVQALPEGFLGKALYFLSACVAAALLEEGIFRGYVQGLLHPYGGRLAIVVTSVLFALMHASAWELPAVFLLSLMLGYVREVSGSVRPCVALHLANNVYTFVMLLARESMAGPAALALTIWMMLLFIALFAWAVWAVRRFRLGPKLRLKRDAPALGPPGRRMAKLLGAPGFFCGAVAAATQFALQFFVVAP